MKLSLQAHGALMMCLQKAIVEETDIRPLLDNLEFVVDDDEPEFLLVTNPPTFTVAPEIEEKVNVVPKDPSFVWNEG